MSAQYDAAIIGGGHNGLVCAAYLARAGKRVIVIEASSHLGGAAITRDFADGFRVNAGAHLLHLWPRALSEELALPSHGLPIATEAMQTIALSPTGAHVYVTQDRVTGVSDKDAAAYGAFMARLRRMAAHLRPAMQAAPPRLGSAALRDQLPLLRLGWAIRSLGRRDMRELLRIIGMNIYDLVGEYFDSPILRGAVAFDAVLGTNYGPRAPSTMLTYLYRLAGEVGAAAMAQPAGGMATVSAALASAARAAGAEIRVDAKVARILVSGDRAVGVALENGDQIDAPCVISNADPRTTFLNLLGAAHLDTGFVRRITHFRSQGLCAKLHLALAGAPQFRGLGEAPPGARLLIAPSPEHLERAFNPTKYGACSEAPALEITIPSARDPTFAPPGQHVLSAIVQYAPYAVRGGWAEMRAGFLQNIIDTLAVYAPDLRAMILHTELLTPADIEREFRTTGGHWHHGEMAFDQFFMVRPVPGAARYKTPLPGLFLCGAGAHPGGGVMGLAGRNAARAILKDAR